MLQTAVKVADVAKCGESGPGSAGVVVEGDADLVGGLLEHGLDGEGVGERHRRRLEQALGEATVHLVDLERVAGPGRGRHDLLGVVAAAVQHDAVRVVEAGRHVDPALGSEHARGSRRLVERRAQGGRPAVAVAEQVADLAVDPGRQQRPGRVHLGRVAQHHLRQADDVDPQVEDRAAAEVEGEQPVLRVEVARRTEVGDDAAHLPDRAVGQELAQPDDRRLEARPHRLHREDAALARRRHDGLGTRERRGERLLHEQRLAGLEHRAAVRDVPRVRGGDVDGVHLVVGEQRLVAAVRPRDAVALRERLRTLRGPGADGDQLAVAHVAEVGDDRLGDRTRSEHRPAHHEREPSAHDGHMPTLAATATDLREQWERLRAWLEELPDPASDEPSTLPGWSLGVLVAHLGRVWDSIRALRTPEPGEDAEPLTLAEYLATYRADDPERLDRLAHEVAASVRQDPLAAIDALAEDALARVDELVAEGDVVLLARRGPIRLGDFLVSRLIELVVHAYD